MYCSFAIIFKRNFILYPVVCKQYKCAESITLQYTLYAVNSQMTAAYSGNLITYYQIRYEQQGYW